MEWMIINKLPLKSAINRRSKPTSNQSYKIRFRVWFGLAQCGFVPLLATAPQPTTAGEPRWSRRNQRQMHPPTFLLCLFDRPPSLFRVVVRVGWWCGTTGASPARQQPNAGPPPVALSPAQAIAGLGSGASPPLAFSLFLFSQTRPSSPLHFYFYYILFLFSFFSFG